MKDKLSLINEIKDFNPFVFKFRALYRRDPLDYDEMREYLLNECAICEIKNVLISQKLEK